MTVIGIDPGTRHLGWGVVRRVGNRAEHVAHGVISTDPKAPMAERLLTIDRELSHVIQQYEPRQGAVETLFFHKDVQAAAKLGHARGVVLVALARQGVSVAEYEPARVKRTIAGGGQASKEQVAMMVQAQLGLGPLPRADATDALALALTHVRLGGFEERLAATMKGNPALARLLQKPRRRR